MELPQKAIDEFIRIWEKEFGEKLSSTEGRYEAEQFMRLCMMIAQPLPNEPG